jgi:hypothetical protein
MSTPIINVEIDFSTGAAFAYPLILDDFTYGRLDEDILGDAPADIVNITDQVMRISTRRGRNRILSNFEVGTATVTINDPLSWFNPFNTESPYVGKLVPLRKIRIYATMEYEGNPIEINIFSGYITSYDTNFYSNTDATSTVTLQCSDGFRLLNNVTTGPFPIPGATANQLSGERVDKILDLAGFPDSMRQLDIGNSRLQVDPGGARSVLAAIQTVEQSEFGAFFMERSGKTVFLSRDAVSKAANIEPRYYSDTNQPGSLTYTNLDFAYDDQLILNDVTVTRYNDGVGPAPIPQNAFSAESVATYFTKSGQRSDILVQTDQEANDQARTLLVARENANLRIDSMSLNLYASTDDESYLINLSSDIYSLVVISKLMPGGSFITRELFIQGVQHDISPGIWNIKLLTAEPLIQAFILDSEEQGILSVNNLSY